MMGSRARVIALIFGVALAGALSACATHEEPAAPAAAPVVAAAQCYWLSNAGAGWVARPDLSEAELCFEMDSCSGGVGLSGGGCYKWAIGADAPAIPWSELGFQPLSRAEPAAASQSPTPPANPQLAADIPPPEDIYQGDFERTSDCTNDACTPAAARMRNATPIYARADRSSPRVGDVAANECVRPEDYRILDTPLRGVVLEPYGPFAAGDVIYRLAYAGEGNYNYWRRGEFIYESDAGSAVRWDEPSGPPDPRVGIWMELTRANGMRGWAPAPDFTVDGCEFTGR